MNSEKAKEFIDGCMSHLEVEMSDHAKWQLRAAMANVGELAESDARNRARKAFCAMCSIPECTAEWSEDFYSTGCQNAPAEFLKHYDNE